MNGSVVAVVAHPDDESLIAGGTLALAKRAGAISLTRGELGPISAPDLATPATLGDVRADELRAAGAELGLAFTACLRHPDGELEWVDQEAAATELAGLLIEHEAAAVLTFGDDGLYGHRDHVAARRIAGLAVQRLDPAPAVYEAAWPAGLVTELVAVAKQRGLPRDLWGVAPEAFGSEAASPDVVVDVTAVLDRKVAAIRAHRTQLDGDQLLYALPDDLAARFLASEPWRRASGDHVLPSLLRA
jgi:LmbE family N-acetylglucosaminyl deacetylase